jgi:hypothetical protein
MVVNHGDGGTRPAHRGPEDLGGAHHAAVDRSLIHHLLVDYIVLRVQAEHP